MGKASKITRRTLLVGSAAVGGGVVFGFYSYHTPHDNPLKETLAKNEVALTPYVKITETGVTLITPRSDFGQGAYHIQAALLAEELDIELHQITIDPGQPSPAYWNTALASEATPFAVFEKGVMAESMRGTLQAVMKLSGMQITGGSSTVADAFEKLRVAGAIARETLKAAAALKLGTDIASLRTEKGAVIAADGKRLMYTELAKDAAVIPIVEDVVLKPESEWRLIGKNIQRVDILAKSTGALKYGIDLSMEGMMFATVRTNPSQGGKLLSYNAKQALGMRGVKNIVEVTGGIAVIANNTWRAMKAADAVNCQWGPAVFPQTMEEHWQTLERSLNDEDRLDGCFRDDGDVESALESSDVIKAEYKAPYLAHAPLEPLNAVVKVQANRVDIWTGTQIPRFIQNNVASITGIDPEDVHVHVQMMGGSFGHRLEDNYVCRAVEVAMTMPGVPVKMTYSREQDFGHDYVRQIAMARGHGSVSNIGVDTFDLSLSMPSITASQLGRQGLSVPGPDAMMHKGAFDQPYDIPNYRVSVYKTPELAPISSWRSVGASTNVFFHESFLDELIIAAGKDPLEERIRLCSWDIARQVLLAVGEMCDWQGSHPGTNKGRGIALGLSFGVPVAEVVEVTQTSKGIRIDNVWVATDVGKVLDPVNFDNHVKGGVVWGLGHAMNCEITYENGIAQQLNYHAFEGMRMYQCPTIAVKTLSNRSEVRGIGEPMVPPASAALANAIYAATGKRIREMPFNKHIQFV